MTSSKRCTSPPPSPVTSDLFLVDRPNLVDAKAPSKAPSKAPGRGCPPILGSSTGVVARADETISVFERSADRAVEASVVLHAGFEFRADGTMSGFEQIADLPADRGVEASAVLRDVDAKAGPPEVGGVFLDRGRSRYVTSLIVQPCLHPPCARGGLHAPTVASTRDLCRRCRGFHSCIRS